MGGSGAGGPRAEGWYVDPEHPGRQRWWDGTGWTEPTREVLVLDSKQYLVLADHLQAIRRSVGFLAAVVFLTLVLWLTALLATLS